MKRSSLTVGRRGAGCALLLTEHKRFLRQTESVEASS